MRRKLGEETNSKAPSEKSSASSSISGAVNDKTVVEDTQKFNQNLQDNVDGAEKQVENAANKTLKMRLKMHGMI